MITLDLDKKHPAKFSVVISFRLPRYSNMKKRLEKLGYVIAAAECNAADFGVPQQRRRAWVLGILKSELKTNSEQLIADLTQHPLC